MRYVVTAPYVVVETRVGPGRAAVDVGRGRELPDDVPAETLAVLVASGKVAEVKPEKQPVKSAPKKRARRDGGE